jgi:hypothetical protein
MLLLLNIRWVFLPWCSDLLWLTPRGQALQDVRQGLAVRAQCGNMMQFNAKARAHLMQAALQRWGWQLEPPHQGTYCSVHAVPSVVGHPVPADSLGGFVDTVMSAATDTRRAQTPDVLQPLLQSIACRSAVMFGRPLQVQEMRMLVRNLAAAKLPFDCAHGRPTTSCIADLTEVTSMLRTRQRALRLQSARTAARCRGTSDLRARVGRALHHKLEGEGAGSHGLRKRT